MVWCGAVDFKCGPHIVNAFSKCSGLPVQQRQHSQTSNGLSLAAGRLVWPATATAAATLEFDALVVPHIGL